jgi:soluble cytochrome b562
MNVSSSGASSPSSTHIEVMKKAMETQEQQVLKVLQSSSEESQKMAAYKTGLGNNLNITA